MLLKEIKLVLRIAAATLLTVLFASWSCELSAQTFSAIPGHGIPALTNAKTQWVDFNNDGLLDLFVSGTNNLGALHTAVYKSNGNNTFNTIGLTALTDIAFDFGDFNKDGYVDIVTSGVNSLGEKKTILYRNTGGTGFATVASTLQNLSKGAVLWSDLDDDTDLDLILTGLDASNQEKTFVYEYSNGTYVAISHSLPQVSNGSLYLLDANNDDHPEVLLTGLNASGTAVSTVYTFKNDLHTTIYTNTLDGTAFNAVIAADYNGDGFEDLFTAGLSGSALVKTTSILENNGTSGFINIASSLKNLSGASLDAGDLSNDGKVDLLLSGIDDGGLKYFKYYRNGSSFTDAAHTMPNLYNGDVALGDYDNDGDLDIFQIGNSDISFQANLYASDKAATIANSAPSVPANLSVVVKEDSVYFSWDSSTDDLTTSGSLTYNLYISNSPNGADLVVSPLSDVGSGYRKVMSDGNAGYKKSKSFHALADGRYYWSVQAIDNGYKASDFAAEQSFSVCASFDLGPDQTICYKDEVTLTAGNVSDEVNWYSKQSGLLLADNREFNFSVLASDTIIAEIDRSYGCIVRDTIVVRMSAPPAIDLGADAFVCHGEEFFITVTDPVDSVNWYNPDGILKQNSEGYAYTVNIKDTLIGQFYNEFRCVSYDSVIVDVLPLPQFSAGIDRSVCYNENTLFEVTGTWDHVYWNSTELGPLATNTNSYLLRVTQKDTVFAEVHDAHGCINYDSAIVQVLALPVISLGEDRSVCDAEDVTIHLSGSGTSINWFNTAHQPLASGVSDYSYQVLQKDTTIVEVINADNCVSYDSIIVHVLPLPQFTIGSDTEICYKEHILLEAGSGFQRVDWFSKVKGEIINPDSWFFNYQVLATDTLIAKVLNSNGCLNYDSIRIKMLPLPDFMLGEDLGICYRSEFELEVAGMWAEVNWYTNNDIILAADNPVFKYSAEQSMPIWAEVFDSHGCVQYDTIQVNVLSLPQFDLGNPRSYCKGDQVELSVTANAGSYAWRNKEGDVLGETHAYSFASEKSTQIFLQVKDDLDCTFLDSLTITVNPLPEFTVDGNRVICAHDTASLKVEYANAKYVTWNVGDVVLSSESQLFMPFSESKILVVTLVDNNNCTAENNIDLTVNSRPVADAGDDLLLCYGESAALGGNSSDHAVYQWVPAKGLSDDGAANPISSALETLTYALVVTNDKNCSSVDSIYVEVNPQIIVNAGSDISVCIGDSVKLGGEPTASGSKFQYTYQWLAGEQSLTENIANPRVRPLVTTLYYVLVSSGKCQVEYDSVVVVVNSLPEISIISDQSIGAGSAVTLNAQGGIKYEWFPKESLTNANSDSPEANPLKTTLYRVLVTDANNCTDTASVKVFVQNNLFIPNLFSPNGDGSNDVFKLYGSGVDRIILSVFDQKGNEVFRTENKAVVFDTGWDGRYAGKVLKDDIYIWTIDGAFYNGERINYQGKNTGIIRLMR
jgi:gliding motility-associated-like protein